MPELPEVETVKRALLHHLKDHYIESVEVLYPKMIHSSIDDFMNYFHHIQILDIKRRGKYILFILSQDKILISHLRMEGKYLYYQEDEEISSHAKIIFHLDQNEKVVYDDVRCFGTMELISSAELEDNTSLSKLGKEPFSITAEELLAKFKSCKKEIKSALLDQSIMCGIGNIYADEILYKSKINPYKKANSLTLLETKNLLKNAQGILNKAIELGGSTVSTYHPENGVDGKFQILLSAYGKEKTPCLNCGSLLLKDFCHGRGTTYCPSCQHVSKKVAIYGKIASGKSTVRAYFASLGYPTFSSDDCVKNIYAHSLQFKKQLILSFGERVLNDNGSISKGYIKQRISVNPEEKKLLESILHPLVKKEIEKFCLENKEKELVFIEIPLLFEARFQNLVDYIIGVDASRITQENHLMIRGSKTPLLDLKINESSKFDQNVDKCDYMIHNNGSLEDLYKECDRVLLSLKKK